MFDNRTATHFH